MHGEVKTMIQLVAVSSVFGLGIAFSVLGALKLNLVKQLSIDDAQFGKLISALMFTSIFVVLAFGPLVDMFGYKPIAIIGFLLGSAAVFMLIFTDSYPMALFSCMILAVGAMCMNLGNTLLPMVIFKGNPTAASNFGNVFFGLGAFLTPFIIGMLLKKIGYRMTGSVIAVILLIPVLFALLANYPEVQKTGLTFAQAFAVEFGLLANPVIIVSALALFCYISLEVSMGGWITTYLTDIGYDDKAANLVLSLFWIGLLAARLVTSTLITPEIGVVVIGALAIAATITIGIMVAAKAKGIGALFVVLTGCAFGPIFPTVVGVTFSKIDPGQYGSAFGIIFAVGLFGGSTIPAAIGSYAKGKTIQQSLIIAVAAAAILVLISIFMGLV